MKTQLLLAMVLLWPTALYAEDDAVRLATVLAAERPCGLAFDTQAIESWIEMNVAADDLDFAGDLRLYVSGKEYEWRSIGASEKAALCAQTSRVAKSFGFLK